MHQRVPAFCPLCVSRCGCEAVVEDGRLVAIEPDPSHPTGAALCAKGRASPELVEAADRLLYPLRRTRPKGDPDPGWQRIGWDEALDETAAGMQRIAAESGAEALAFAVTTSAGTAISDAGPWVNRLINAFGSPNNCNAYEICSWHRDFAAAFTTGVGHGRAGLRAGRLHPAMGPQSQHVVARRRRRGRRGAGARRQARRGRSAPGRAGGEGRPLAAGAAGHRWRARARRSPAR